MSEFRILDFNYCFDEATNFYPTSEDPSFLASNLAHPFRSKVWRSSGYFVVTSTNKYIDFKQTGGGTQRHAVLTVGQYTPTTLAAEMVAALEDVGSGEFTVSYDTDTGLWTISSDRPYLSILWSTGTNTANALASTIGFIAGDSTGATSYTGQTVAIHTEERVTIDLGADQDIDSFAMVFDPQTGPKFSNDAVLTLQACAANTWASPSVSQVLSLDNIYDSITHFFVSSQNYRYWSLKIVDPTNPYFYVEVPKILLSKATQLGQVPQIGFVSRFSDMSKKVETPYGHVYADLYPTRKSFKFNYEFLSAEDIETLYQIVQRVGTVTPVGIALDPTATLFDKDRFFIYGRFDGDTEMANAFYSYFNVPLSIVEAF